MNEFFLNLQGLEEKASPQLVAGAGGERVRIFIVIAQLEGWRMVKSETRRDAEILVRNPSPKLFGKKFRDSKKVKTNHAKTRFRDLSKTLPTFRDPAKILRDTRFSRYHSPPLIRVDSALNLKPPDLI